MKLKFKTTPSTQYDLRLEDVHWSHPMSCVMLPTYVHCSIASSLQLCYATSAVLMLICLCMLVNVMCHARTVRCHSFGWTDINFIYSL
jgi:hypothetical protein